MITLNLLKQIIDEYDVAPKQQWSEFIVLPSLIRNLKKIIALVETQKHDTNDDVILSYENLFELINQTDLFYDYSTYTDERTILLRNCLANAINQDFVAEIIKIFMLLRQHNLLDLSNYNRVIEMSKEGSNCYIDVLWDCMNKLNQNRFFSSTNYSQLTQNYWYITGIYSILALLIKINSEYSHYRLLKQTNLDAIFQYASVFNDPRVRWAIDNLRAEPKLFTADVFKNMIDLCQHAKDDQESTVNAVCDYLTKIAGIDQLYQSNMEIIKDTTGVLTELQPEFPSATDNIYLLYPAAQKFFHYTQEKHKPVPTAKSDELPPFARYLMYFVPQPNQTSDITSKDSGNEENKHTLSELKP